MGPSRETAGGGSPRAGGSGGEGSPNTGTATSGTGGGPSHRARAAGTEGTNTEVAHWIGTSRGNALPPRTGTSGASGVGPEHSGRAPAWFRWRWGTRERGRRGRLNATVDAGTRTVGRMEAREKAGEQECRGRSRAREGDRQLGDRPED